MPLHQFLLISALVHAALFFSLKLALQPEPFQAPIEIEFQQSQPAKATGQSLGKATQVIAPRANKKAPPQPQLDFGLSTTRAVVSSYQANAQNPLTPDSGSEADGNSQVTFDPYDGMAMPEIRFVRSLWREIDKSIVNSPYLSEYGHVGKVRLSFQVGTDGKLIESSFTAKADDRVLKVIAARAIRKALQNETGEISLPTEHMTIHTQFAWSGYETCTSLRGSTKNYLSFCNYAENKIKTFSGTEKAATYLGALKYGLDAADEIKKYQREEMRRNTRFNPFEDFERDPDWNLGT